MLVQQNSQMVAPTLHSSSAPPTTAERQEQLAAHAFQYVVLVLYCTVPVEHTTCENQHAMIEAVPHIHPFQAHMSTTHCLMFTKQQALLELITN